MATLEASTCLYCGEPAVSGPIICAGVTTFHPECFRCSRCQACIGDDEQYALVGLTTLFCKSCWAENNFLDLEDQHVIKVVKIPPLLDPIGDTSQSQYKLRNTWLNSNNEYDDFSTPQIFEIGHCGSECPLSVGDRILEVNGTPVHDHSLPDIEKLLNQRTSVVQVTVEQTPLTEMQTRRLEDSKFGSLNSLELGSTDLWGSYDEMNESENRLSRRSDERRSRSRPPRRSNGCEERAASLSRLSDCSPTPPGYSKAGLARTLSFREQARSQCTFRACDLVKGELLGMGFFGQCHGENVYNLIEKHESQPLGPAMYRSRYACMVRQQANCNKSGCYRTMGIPKVCLCPPENFLKKNSRAPISICPPAVPTVQMVTTSACQASESQECGDGAGQADGAGSGADGPCIVVADASGTAEGTGSGDCGNGGVAASTSKSSCEAQGGQTVCCGRPRIPRICCNVEKPPVPPACVGLGILPTGDKDFVRDNAIKVIRGPPKIPEARVVDHPKGHRFDWCSSGLPRRFVCREDYGMIPGYLVQRKRELYEKDLAAKYELERPEREARERCRHLDETERSTLICGLKQSWAEAYREFQLLPLMIDTPGKVKRKSDLETTLKALEKDIQLLERHNHIFVADANKSFYLA